MTPTAWALTALLILAGFLSVWAATTGGPGPDQRHELVRQRPAHSRKARNEDTRQLRPPAPDWLPPRERPGGEAQRLPARDDLPW